MNSIPLLLPDGFMGTANSAAGANSLCSVGFPRMVGVLFCDLGEGFSDEHIIVDDNFQMLPQFNFRFILPDTYSKSIRFRIDPCEFGGIMISNLQIILKGEDGTEKDLGIGECVTNGTELKESIFFLHYDPQICWKNRDNVCEIIIKGEVTMEIPENIIQKAILQENRSKDISTNIWGRIKRKIIKK